MSATIRPHRPGQLERLCGQQTGDGAVPRDRIRIGFGAEGIERLEAHFVGRPFAPHRHDTYAIGMTLSGVQTFNYRGERWYCLPGQCHILHPDESHDGAAGTDAGFSYRIIYIDPSLVRDAIGGGALPFAAQAVVDAAVSPAGFRAQAFDIDVELDEVACVDVVDAAVLLLLGVSSDQETKYATSPSHRIRRVREAIAACPAQRYSMAELEQLSGLDRWTIARQFRAQYGTSPSRFRTLRQLDHVRQLMNDGTSLAQAAAEAGFADQSHMSRRFKSAYGLTPAAWAVAIA